MQIAKCLECLLLLLLNTLSCQKYFFQRVWGVQNSNGNGNSEEEEEEEVEEEEEEGGGGGA